MSADPTVTLAATPKVVLVHDWLTGMRGGEKVLESICRLFPTARLVTLVHRHGAVSRVIEGRPIDTSFIQRLPKAVDRYRHYLPLFPSAVESLDLDDAELVISTSHCAAKAVIAPGKAVHLCYCHSPMRYAWDQFEAYFGPERLGGAGSALARPVLDWLARWDRATSSRVDEFIANSRFVAGRIARYYNRQASVLYPPVDTEFFSPGRSSVPPYFLVVSALVPYKRIDIAVEAATRLGVPLKVVGSGPDAAALRASAGSSVEFVGPVSTDELRDLYRGAIALVHPAEEDFGISPVEAMASGCPVIAFARGGATETVSPGVTGWLVDSPTADRFAEAMREAAQAELDRDTMVRHAGQFSVARFEAGFASLVRAHLEARPC